MSDQQFVLKVQQLGDFTATLFTSLGTVWTVVHEDRLPRLDAIIGTQAWQNQDLKPDNLGVYQHASVPEFFTWEHRYDYQSDADRALLAKINNIVKTRLEIKYTILALDMEPIPAWRQLTSTLLSNEHYRFLGSMMSEFTDNMLAELKTTTAWVLYKRYSSVQDTLIAHAKTSRELYEQLQYVNTGFVKDKSELDYKTYRRMALYNLEEITKVMAASEVDDTCRSLGQTILDLITELRNLRGVTHTLKPSLDGH